MEYSPLQAVDFALGRLLVEIYGNQRPDHGPANWRAFLGRENKHKILRGDFETVNDITKSMESSEKNAGGGNVKINPVNLPLIVYGRKPQLTVSEAEAGSYIIDMPVTDEDGNDMRLSAAQLNVEYRVAMMAWDRATLDTMQLAWLFHVAKPGQHRIRYNMKVGDSDIEIPGEIIDPKAPQFEDASLTRDEGRLHATVLPVTIKVYSIMGNAKVVIPDGFEWAIIPPTDNWFGPGSDWGIGGDPYAPGGGSGGPGDGSGGPGGPGSGDPNDPSNPGGGGPGSGTGGICGGLSCWPNRL